MSTPACPASSEPVRRGSFDKLFDTFAVSRSASTSATKVEARPEPLEVLVALVDVSRMKSRDDGPLRAVVTDDVSRDVDSSLRSPVRRSTRSEPQDQAGGELCADLIRGSDHG